MTTKGEQEQREHRVYNPVYKDYHNWDAREDQAYHRWLETKHEAYVDYERPQAPARVLEMAP